MNLPQFGTDFRRTFQKGVRFAGLDADVFSTLLFRGWSIFAGAAMVFLIPASLTAVEQGYYYTFASLLALQIFFELGMNQVILQLVSHDFAHLRFSTDFRLVGDPERFGRLSSLIRLLRRWYLVAAMAFFAIVSTSGAAFLSRKADLVFDDWLGPWVLLTLATAMNLYFSAMITVLEGCGEVAHVARMRLTQSLVGSVLTWIALVGGAGLWAVPIVSVTAALYTAYWLHVQGGTLRQLACAGAGGAHPLQWMRDVFPFQWRIALSWISGYFIFQLLTPLAFARHGPEEAGRLGITLAVFNAILTVGMSWVNAKAPAMAGHISRRERSQVNRLFIALTRRALGFTGISVVLAVLTLLMMGQITPMIAHRFSSVPVAICIAMVTLANTFVFAAAAYMRAHKEEPMLWVSLVSGIATLGAAVGGSEFGVLPMMLLYAFVTVCISLPWTIRLFRHYYQRSA